MKHQVVITFQPRWFTQNVKHLNNPSIKTQAQSHVANRLELLCNFEHIGPISVQVSWNYNRVFGKSDEIKRQYLELVATKTSLSRIPRITQTSTRYNMDTGVPVSAGIRPQPLLLFMMCLKTTNSNFHWTHFTRRPEFPYKSIQILHR